MSKITQTILKWLGFAETVETDILTRVPLASFGPAGEILGIVLLAESTATAVLQDINALKQASASTPAPAPAAAPAA